jgi:hypothetical protein
MDLELTVFLRSALVAVLGTRQSIFAFLYTTSSHDGLLEYIIEAKPSLNHDVFFGDNRLSGLLCRARMLFLTVVTFPRMTLVQHSGNVMLKAVRMIESVEVPQHACLIYRR